MKGLVMPNKGGFYSGLFLFVQLNNEFNFTAIPIVPATGQQEATARDDPDWDWQQSPKSSRSARATAEAAL